MDPKAVTIQVSESIGTVSGLLITPENMKALLVLAHGAGAGMEHSFMKKLSELLADRSIGTLRYNFPFVENGKKRPDVAPVAEKTTAAAMLFASELFPDVPLFASGKSFGGRMSSHYLSKASPPYIRGIIFYGFPLHAAGDPGITRAAHLGDIKVPMLFLQGTRDALANLELMREVCGSLKQSTLATFEGADHSFKAGKKEFVSELANKTETWVTSLLSGKS